jgi:IS4 transposase
MARSIVAAIAQIKSELADILSPPLIRGVCQTIGHVWRKRQLDPVTTVHLFLLQVLHGNAACAQVPRLGGVPVSGEAYCQARKRLPVRLLRTLVRLFSQSLQREALDDGRWHGHRTFHVDGTGVSMSDTPALQTAFGQPGTQKPGCGFPVMRLVALFHAGTGLLLNMVGAPLRSHDLSEVGPLHGELQPGDILIGDRAFCSFAHLATLAAHGVFGLFRGHSSQIVDFRPRRPHRRKRSRNKPNPRGLPSSVWLKRLGRSDQLVAYVKPQRPARMSRSDYVALPASLRVRELRFTVRRGGYRPRAITLVTTLLDPNRYPAADVATLYRQRWQVETNLRHLKQTLKMDVLRCQTVDGVRKEVLIYAFVYNLVRSVVREAANRQRVPASRISFVDAVRWLADAIHHRTELKLRLNGDRPGRTEPRVIKRRRKHFPFMTRPRAKLRQAMRKRQLAA